MDSHRGRFDIVGTLAVVGALIGWSIGPIYIKLLSRHLDFWTQNALRYGVASLFWLPFMIFWIYSGRFNRRIFVLGIVPSVANVIMQSFWALAFYHVNPAFMSLLVKSSVLWVALFSIFLFRPERGLLRSRRFWAGMVLSVAGVFGVVTARGDFAVEGSFWGIVIASAAAFFWAIYTVSVKYYCHNIDARHSFAVISLYTTAGLLVLAVLFGDMGQCAELTFEPISWILISSVVAIALSHVMYYTGIKRIGATIPALILLASPFTVLSISHFVLGETLTMTQLLFGLVLIAGAGLATWAQEHISPAK